MKVSRLSTTPIKGLKLHHPQSVHITDRGVVGDREFFLTDESGDMFSPAKTGELSGFSAVYDEPQSTLTIFENAVVIAQANVKLGEPTCGKFFSTWDIPGHFILGPWEEIFSERLGRPVKMIKAGPERSGTDVGRLTLVSDASFAALQSSAKLSELDGRRFRMNIEVEGADAHDEDTWLNREFTIGTAVIKAGGPVQRCVATTRNPDTGIIDLKTLKLIGDYRGRQESEFGLGFNFGIYAYCIKPGVISVGDKITS